MRIPKNPIPILLIGSIDPQLWEGLPTQTIEVGSITLKNHILPKVTEKGVKIITLRDPEGLDQTSRFVSILEKGLKGKLSIIPTTTVPFGQEDNWDIRKILAIEPVKVVEGVPELISSFHYKLTFLRNVLEPTARWFSNLGFC